MEMFENYIKEPRMIDVKKMSKLSFFFALITMALFVFIFFYANSNFSLDAMFTSRTWLEIVWLFIKLILWVIIGICLHELVHGIFFALFAKRGFKSIKFGILTNPVFAFYCHSSEPLKVRQYMLAAIMPLVLTGILPAIIAVLNTDLILLMAAYVLTIGAIGDLMMIQMLMKESKNSYVLDHPTDIGFYILKDNNHTA